MNRIPRPGAGNTLTVREYQTRWLDAYTDKLDAADDTATCASTDVSGEWALPLPREIVTAEMVSAPHHTYPAWDARVPEGTPVYAITGDRVARVTTWTSNWWHTGCGRSEPPADCNTCGVGITIEHPDGLRHTYCHNVRNHVAVGDEITRSAHRRQRQLRSLRHTTPPPRTPHRRTPLLPTATVAITV